MAKGRSPLLPDLPEDDPGRDAAVRRRLDDLGASMALLPQRPREGGAGRDTPPADRPRPAASRQDDRSRNRGMPGTVSVSVMLPIHTNRDLTIRAAQRGVTKRYLIVEALRRDGYDVRDEDLTEDGRRRLDA